MKVVLLSQLNLLPALLTRLTWEVVVERRIRLQIVRNVCSLLLIGPSVHLGNGTGYPWIFTGFLVINM